MWYSGKNIPYLRLGDAILLYAECLNELGQTAQACQEVNKVRSRAGLADVAYSLTALQNERRWELAFEGVRWNDIRRWGIAGDLLQNQIGQPCYFKGVAETTKAFGSPTVSLK